MTKAAELAKMGEVLTNSQIGGRRNIIINGGMNVAQRSTSVTGIGASSGYFTCDRWKITTGNSAGRLTMTQTADGPNGISANCLKLDCTTADTSIAAGELLVLQNNIEGQDLQGIGKGVTGAKEVTLSFYVKANAAFNFVAEIKDVDNNRTNGRVFATTTDWVRHEITFQADVDDGSSPFDDDNALSLTLNFWLHAGSTYTGGTLASNWENGTEANRAAGIDSFYSSTDNNFFLTGVQLEVGSQATPFEHRSFGEELALCQRYYIVIADGSNVNDTGYAPVFMGAQYDGATFYAQTQLPTEMRTFPTVEVVNSSNYYGLYRNGAVDLFEKFTINKASPRAIEVYNDTAISGTAGHAGFIRTYNANAKFAVVAEL
jgi:hypothetical protein